MDQASLFVGAVAAWAALNVGSALAHPNPPKLFHPKAADLRALAILASDRVEFEDARYIGAVGTCRGEDRAVVKTGPGWKHVRCYMKTKNGYRFTVTWHVTNAGKITETVVRTL